MNGTEQSTRDQRSSRPEASQSWQTLDAQLHQRMQNRSSGFYPPWRQRTSTSSRKQMQRPASDGSRERDLYQVTTKTSYSTSIHHRREWPRHTARPDPLINGKTPCSRTGSATSSDSSWPQRSQLPCCGSSSKESSLFTTGDPVKEERLPD